MMPQVQIFTLRNLKLIYIFRPTWNLLNQLALGEDYYFLSDSLFNKTKVLSFEALFRTVHHAYYFSGNSFKIYDQFERFDFNRRVIESSRHELSFDPIELNSKFFETFPFHQRALDKKGLKGDFLGPVE
jgi:hypothetical protein